MDFSLPCPECKRVLKLPMSAAGKGVRCPMCAHVFSAPDEPQDDAPPRAVPTPAWLLPNVSDTANQPPLPLPPDLPKRAPLSLPRPAVSRSNAPPSPASKPWAGRAGGVVVAIIVLGVARVLFNSSHTTNYPAVNYPAMNYQIPTVPTQSNFRREWLDSKKAVAWHPPSGEASAFVAKNSQPPRRLVLDMNDTSVTGMALSADEKTLVVGCDSGVIYQIYPTTGFVKSVHDGNGKGIVVLAINRVSQQIVATAGKPSRLTMHVPELDLILSSDTDGEDNFHAGVGALAFSPDGKQLATLEDGRLVFRKMPFTLATKAPRFPAQALSFAYSPDGETLAVALQDGTVRLYDRDGARDKQVLQAGAPLRSTPVFSPDGNLLAACVGEKDLVVWDVKAGKELKKLRDARSPIGFKTGVFAPDSKTFAAWQDDGVIRLWDVSTGDVVRDLAHEPDGGVVPPVLIFTQDGNTLIAGGGKTVTFWDVGKGQPAGKPKTP